MKKALIMTSVAFVLLLAVVAAGLNVIFTITYIEASFSTFSVQGEEDAKSLKAELDEFVGASMTFLDLEEVKEKVEKYPSFRLESVKKNFPKTVEISVTERRELFAYQMKNGQFAMIDTEGNCIRMSDENVSRTGGENVLLKNFRLTAEVGKRVEGDYFDELLEAFAGFEEHLTDARANICEVELGFGGNESNPLTNLFEVRMQEGSVIAMYNPLFKAKEKAEKAVAVYSGLDDIQKMYTRIIVVEDLNGEINTNY